MVPIKTFMFFVLVSRYPEFSHALENLLHVISFFSSIIFNEEKKSKRNKVVCDVAEIKLNFNEIIDNEKKNFTEIEEEEKRNQLMVYFFRDKNIGFLRCVFRE